jgi:hypothetical protein
MELVMVYIFQQQEIHPNFKDENIKCEAFSVCKLFFIFDTCRQSKYIVESFFYLIANQLQATYQENFGVLSCVTQKRIKKFIIGIEYLFDNFQSPLIVQ